MENKLIIRPFRESDLERVIEIALVAWEPIYLHRRELLGPEIFDLVHPHWHTEKAEGVRASCTPETACVAELEERLVAFITYHQTAPEVGEISNNAVYPPYQGRGIATALYEFVLAHMRAQGLKVVKVFTGGDDAHRPARRAYQKAGFDIEIPSVTLYQKL